MERNAKFIITVSFFICATLGIVLYTILQSREYLRGPQLTITNPHDGSTVSEPLITIEGKTQNVAEIYLNGAAIFIDKQGYFGQKLLLLPGYNILTVSVQDRFGKKVEKTLQLVYAEKENSSTSLPSVATTTETRHR